MRCTSSSAPLTSRRRTTLRGQPQTQAVQVTRPQKCTCVQKRIRTMPFEIMIISCTFCSHHLYQHLPCDLSATKRSRPSQPTKSVFSDSAAVAWQDNLNLVCDIYRRKSCKVPCILITSCRDNIFAQDNCAKVVTMLLHSLSMMFLRAWMPSARGEESDC